MAKKKTDNVSSEEIVPEEGLDEATENIVTDLGEGARIDNPGNSGIASEPKYVTDGEIASGIDPGLTSPDREFRVKKVVEGNPDELVPVRFKNDVKCYIGNRKQRVCIAAKAGEVRKVTRNQKEILRNAGHLDVV